MSKWLHVHVLALAATLVPPPASADLYSARQAVEAKDFARAVELYRELAELGHPEAQENLAVMYVNGEGVKRDNVQGYAWAVMARENGAGESSKGIIDQLEPHLNDAARARVAELQAKFGSDASRKTLFPALNERSPVAMGCPIKSVADPDKFYPQEARSRGISGDAIVEYTVYGDGRAHDPHAENSFPPGLFSPAGRDVVLRNVSAPKRVDGVAVQCTMRIKVKFGSGGGQADGVKEQIGEAREKAKRGDPMAQLVFAALIDSRWALAEKGEQAIWWFLKAAQAGIPAAQGIVGKYALLGQGGVVQDEAKGLLWLKKAAQAGDPDAQFVLANYQLRSVADAAELATVVQLLKQSVEGKNREAPFYLSAILATSSEAALRDPARAIELIEKAMWEYGSNPIAFEIRAAAHAQSGDFKQAQKDQAYAVRLAQRLGWNVAPQKARLADYTAGKAWTGDLFAFY